MADGSQAHLVDSGQAVTTLQSQEKTTVSFTPWNGWMDSSTYNISFYGRLSDGSETGNTRYFHATFADHVDVAILSDTSSRTTAIKQDLAILGMSYPIEINDWPTYFDASWFTHYDKIVLPWQDILVAKDTQFGGDGYYQNLGEPARRTVENFMSAGGTIKLTWAHSEVRFTAPTKAWQADCRLAWTSKAETQRAPRSPTTRWILPTLTTPSWTTSTSTPSRALTPTPVWHKRC